MLKTMFFAPPRQDGLNGLGVNARRCRTTRRRQNERFVASKQDFISYIFIHIAKCGIRIFCMLATPIYEKGIISLLFKIFPKPLIILIDMKR